MGCLIAIVASLVPRLAMIGILLFTGWFGRAYATMIWPLLGFFCMPYTTLAYMAAMLNNNHQLSGGWLALFMFAIVVDAGHWGGSAKCRKR